MSHKKNQEHRDLEKILREEQRTEQLIDLTEMAERQLLIHIIQEGRKTNHLLTEILGQLTPPQIPAVKSADIQQIGEKVMADAITPGIQVGKTGTFQLGNLQPTGSAFPAGTVFTYAVDDTTNSSITSNSDGTGTLAVNQAAPIGNSAVVSVTAVDAAGAPLATVLNSLSVPYLSDVVNVPTSADVQQIS